MKLLEKILKVLPNQLPLGVIILDPSDTIIYVNTRALICLKTEMSSLLNKSIYEIHSPQHHARVRSQLKLAKEGECVSWDGHKPTLDKHLNNNCSGVFDEEGNLLGSVLMIVDMTEQIKTQEELEQSNSKLLALYNSTKVINASLDLDVVLPGILKIASQTVKLQQAAIYLKKQGEKRLTLASCMPDGCQDNNSELELSTWSKETKNALRGLVYHGEKDHLIPLMVDNEVIGVLHCHAREYLSPESDNINLLIAVANQAAIAIKNALSYQETKEIAIVDGLTQLYNRKHFYDILALESERMKRDAASLGVIMIDINHLKQINDNLGHLMGDYYIKEAAQIIKSSVRKIDNCFRYGGDEMLILCPKTDSDGIFVIEQRIRSQVELWNTANQQGGLPLSLSIGHSVATDINDLSEVVEEADKKMYEDKRKYYDSLKQN